MDSYEGERDDQEEKCKRNGKRPESGRARERASERESVAVAMVENKNAFALCTRESDTAHLVVLLLLLVAVGTFFLLRLSAFAVFFL